MYKLRNGCEVGINNKSFTHFVVDRCTSGVYVGMRRNSTMPSYSFRRNITIQTGKKKKKKVLVERKLNLTRS